MTPASPLGQYQALVFAVTYALYIVVYFTRKPFSAVKPIVGEALGMSPRELGVVDSLFLVSYAVGQFVVGPFGDRFGARTMLAVSLGGSAAAVALMGQAESPHTAAAAWATNGFFQAMAFPLMMKALSPWFSAKSRGKVFGLWTTCQQVGGVAAVSFAGYAADSASLGWRYSFRIPAMLGLAAAIAVRFVLIESPEDVGLTLRGGANDCEQEADGEGKVGATDAPESVAKSKDSSESMTPDSTQQENRESLDFLAVLKLPGLANVGAAYFCIKLARYTMLGWLSTYLNKEHNYDAAQAAYMSTLFDIGGAFGSVACGLLSDIIFDGRRIRTILVMGILAGASIAAYGTVAGLGTYAGASVMLLAGFMIAGPDSVLGAAACSDVCERAGYGSSILTTASGIANGMGSIGAILSGIAPVLIFEAAGWNVLFMATGAVAVLGVLLLLPIALMPAATAKNKQD